MLLRLLCLFFGLADGTHERAICHRGHWPVCGGMEITR